MMNSYKSNYTRGKIKGNLLHVSDDDEDAWTTQQRFQKMKSKKNPRRSALKAE